jgi:tetratricopeptide (TPR) repeat protein
MQRRWWLDPNCKYKIALCHLEAGELKEAEAAFQKLLGEHPNTRWKPDALLGLGRVYFDQKQYDKAISQFNALGSLAGQKQFEEWQLRAALWKARASREKGSPDEALALINKIKAGVGEKYKDIAIAASTEEAIIYMAKEQYQKAVDLLQKLIQEIASSVADEIGQGGETRAQTVEATCFNTLGRCYFQQAAKAAGEKQKNLYYEALLSFLWNVVLYQRLPDQHAEALYYAAECFDKLDQRPRATELRNELTQRYPDNPFAQKVRPPERKAAGK